MGDALDGPEPLPAISNNKPDAVSTIYHARVRQMTQDVSHDR